MNQAHSINYLVFILTRAIHTAFICFILLLAKVFFSIEYLLMLCFCVLVFWFILQSKRTARLDFNQTILTDCLCSDVVLRWVISRVRSSICTNR